MPSEKVPNLEKNFRHLDRSSIEYKKIVNKQPRNIAFGENDVQDFENYLERESIEDISNFNQKRTELLEEFLGHKLKSIIRTLKVEKLNNDLVDIKKTLTLNLIKESLESKKVIEKISTTLNINLDNISLDFIIDNLIEGKIKEDVLLEILKVHKEQFDLKAEKLLVQIEVYKSEFIESAYMAIQSGYLPISKEELDSRISELSFSMFDGLDKDYLGEHGKGGMIMLSVDINPEHIRHTVFHELVHGIAGKSIAVYKQGKAEIVFEQKSGLLLRLEQSGKQEVRGAFAWMNEAVTENIAIHLLGKKGDADEETGYQMERHLLKSVVEAGVSEEAFRKAYFEDYIVSAQPGHRMPYWRALAQKMNEVGQEQKVDMSVDIE